MTDKQQWMKFSPAT